MSRLHKPQRGDKVNDQQRFSEGKKANGFIQRITYADGPDEIIVKFDDGIETYDYEDFRYRWTDGYGGVFQLPKRREV